MLAHALRKGVKATRAGKLEGRRVGQPIILHPQSGSRTC